MKEYSLTKRVVFAAGSLMYPALLLFILSSCTSTKYAGSVACLTDFTVGQKVLVVEAKGLPVHQSFNLYENSLSILKKAGVYGAYEVEEDQSLRLYQVVVKTPDSLNLAVLKDKLGYDFLLVPVLENRRSGEGDLYYGPEENNFHRQRDALEEPETKATVRFMLYSTIAGRLIYEVAATTESVPFSLPRKDGGEGMRISVSEEGVIEKAYRKGMKKIMKECECCSGVNL